MIRKATAADLDGCEQVYQAHFRGEREGVAYTNWQEGVYPTRATALAALEAGTLYVDEEDGLVVGCANLNHVQPREYAGIPWIFPGAGDRVLVIHTMVFRPQYIGSGRGRRMVKFAEELGRSQGCTALRLDTYEGNLPARSFYQKLGYHLAGSAEFFFQDFIRETLVCYERDLR